MSLAPPAKRVLLIPYWVKNILTRNQLPLTTLLSLVELQKVLSSEDLVLTMLLNEETSQVFGAPVPTGAASMLWTSCDEDFSQYNRLRELMALHTSGLQDRLFNEQALEPQYPAPFTVQDLSHDAFLVVIYPGYFGGPQGPEHTNELVTTLLKLFYGYSNYDVMARDPLFTPYLSRL